MNSDSLSVEKIILNTVRYFDLFDQPVTATQLWQWQVGAERLSSLSEIQKAADTAVIAGSLASEWGYYYLPHQQGIVRRWMARHALAQQKWKLTRRIATWLSLVPFVRMIAMSGSLAVGNTGPTSDLDLFVIARHRRIWLARLGLLIVAQLLGRRRRYWDRQAPDKVCLNHYITDESLVLATEICNMYTAILYQSLLSLTGESWRDRFIAANQSWIKTFVLRSGESSLPTRHRLPDSRFLWPLTSFVEYVGSEPMWDWLERFAERLQRRYIGLHTEPGQEGRVVVSHQELAFHPNSKVPGLLERYYRIPSP